MTAADAVDAAEAPRPASHKTAGGIASIASGPAGAPLIVLIHGAMDRMAGMHKLARRLDDRYRIIRYDRRGYGQSAPHAGPFGMDEQVGDVVALLGGHRGLLVGHSYGGDVALAAAQRHHDLVEAVVVFEPPQSWEPYWPKDGASAGAAALGVEPQQAAETFLRRLIGDRLWDRLPQATKDARRAEGRALVGELSDLRRRAPFDPQQIDQPVIVGLSEFAKPHHRQGSLQLAAQLPNGQAIELTGCHHNAHASHPDLFAELLIVPALRAAGYEPTGSTRGRS